MVTLAITSAKRGRRSRLVTRPAVPQGVRLAGDGANARAGLWLSELNGGVSSELNGGIDGEVPLTPERSPEKPAQPAIYRRYKAAIYFRGVVTKAILVQRRYGKASVHTRLHNFENTGAVVQTTSENDNGAASIKPSLPDARRTNGSAQIRLGTM